MSKLGYFLGGALLGVAGLSASVFLFKDENEDAGTEQKVDFTPESATGMSAAEVIGHLNEYFMKSNVLGMKSSASCFSVGDLGDSQVAQFSTPETPFWEKARDWACDQCRRVGRKGKEMDLRDFRQRVEGLYQRYRPVFVRANRLLAAQGIVGVPLKEFTLENEDFTLNNAMSNEQWSDDALALNDKLNGFISRTTEAANTLIRKLEALEAPARPAPAAAEAAA